MAITAVNKQAQVGYIAESIGGSKTIAAGYSEVTVQRKDNGTKLSLLYGNRKQCFYVTGLDLVGGFNFSGTSEQRFVVHAGSEN